MISRKNRKRAKRLQKLIGRTLGDYFLHLTPESMEMIDARLKRSNGPMPITQVIPLSYLCVNPTLTKAYVRMTDPIRKKSVYRKLRWLRWFLARPRVLTMAPGAGRG